MIRACISPRRNAMAVKCPLYQLLRLQRFLALVGQHDRLQPRMLDRRRVSQGDEIEGAGEGDEENGERKSAQCPVTPVKRETAHTRRGAGDQNDVQWGLLPTCSVGRVARIERQALFAMVRAPQPLARILRSDATLAGWTTRRDREMALAGIVRRHLPRPLAPRVRVTEERNGQLELAADAGAIAAIVRQRSAELLTALKREGWQFTGIRVRVQVRVRPAAASENPAESGR
jgi:hypothetical protein